MEITAKIRQQIFALYWGQDIFGTVSYNSTAYVNGANIDRNHDILFLTLKPLSSISDEDCTHSINTLLKIFNEAEMTKQSFIEAINDSERLNCMPLAIVDYLRSKSYALPYMDISVQQMVDAGIIRLIEN